MQGASRTTRTTESPAASCVALVAGSVGKLGEELLNQLIASAHTTRVHAITRWDIEASTDKLDTHPVASKELPTDAEALALPIHDEFYCCVSDERSYYRRDDIYHRVSMHHVLPLARAAAARGARRAAILLPMDALQQMSRIGDYLAHEREVELTQLGFETLVIVRPVERGQQARGSVVQRMADSLIDALASYMTPGRFRPRRVVVVARAAIETLASGGPGIHILPIHKLLEEMSAPG